MKLVGTIVLVLALVMIGQSNAKDFEPPDEDYCRQQTEATVQLKDRFSYSICPWFASTGSFTYSDFDNQNKSVTLIMSTGSSVLEINMKQEARYSMVMLHRKDCFLLMDIKILEIGPQGEYVTFDWSIYPVYLDE
jgi:hypothetical protein